MADQVMRRCAIYTRTSSDEGLCQDYNSLASQRDACAAFIASQRQEGWLRIKQTYDDGGFSGGNIDRPALKELLADVAAGQIDIIVIYKIDRLTRSLRDFASLSQLLEGCGASFVSVTQQFNTASTMGRLTLNILLTFAQFEREITADRIRDKRASSTRLGIWMGGNPALGYDAVGKRLVVNPIEAKAVGHIFQRFAELRSLAQLRQELRRNGIVSKQRTSADGEVSGGLPFTWHPLRAILTNPLYTGLSRHRGQVYPGRHAPIIDKALFAEVQCLLNEDAAAQRARRLNSNPSLLKGIIFDTVGLRLYTHHSRRKLTRYDYYISRSKVSPKRALAGGSLMRISAPAMDRFVIDLLCSRLRDRRWITDNFPTLRRRKFVVAKAEVLAKAIATDATGRTLIRQVVRRVEVDSTTIRLTLDKQWMAADFGTPSSKASDIKSPLEIVAEDHELHCTAPVRKIEEGRVQANMPDHRLVREVLRAIRWFHDLSSGRYPSIGDIARGEGCSSGLISDRIRLAFLAPDIVDAILAGRQPAWLTTARLLRSCPLPERWEEQRLLFLGK